MSHQNPSGVRQQHRVHQHLQGAPCSQDQHPHSHLQQNQQHQHFQLHIAVKLDSITDQEAWYPEAFYGFSHFLQECSGVLPQNTPHLLSSSSILIYHLQIIQCCDTKSSSTEQVHSVPLIDTLKNSLMLVNFILILY